MEFKYKLNTPYSGEIDIALQFAEYTNGGTAIQMFCNMEGYPEPWSTLTVWLPGLLPDEVAIDVNNNKNGLEWAIENGLVEPAHRHLHSGYVTYPVCKLKERKE